MDAKKKTALAVLLGLTWVGIVLWQWDAFQEPVRVPLTNVSGTSPAHQVKDKSAGLRVNLELLASARTQREATFTAPRNIFAVPRADGTLPVGNAAIPTSAEVQPSEQALAQQQAASDVAQYHYLGFLRMGEYRKKDIAVLSKNEEVVVVKVGERVEDHLVLKAITPDNVTIRDTGTRTDQTLPLLEDPPAQP